MELSQNMATSGLLLALVWLLAGCASQQPAPVIDRAAPVAQPGDQQVGGSSALAPGAIAPPGYYIVKKGDTLISIGLEHGQSYRDLAAWNNLDNPNKIQVGQQLRVKIAEPEAGAPVAIAKPISIPAAVETSQPVGSSSASPDTEMLKREPKGGKLPYSEEAMAKLQKPEPVSAIEIIPETRSAPVEKPVVKPAPAPAGDDAVEWSWPTAGKLVNNFVDGSTKGLDIAGKTGDPVQAAAAGKVILVSSALRGYGNFLIIKHNAAYLSVYAHNSRILVKEEQTVTKGQKIAEIGSSDSDQPKLHFEIRHQGKPVDPMKFLPAR
ncbi:MAG: peptidoglycan DD-metalloendopeptidase family protein [Sterolibacterium sp.]|nr:peptidoglycan DD-metalloendopeptidase family protein [Sterolibacterium sp.]